MSGETNPNKTYKRLKEANSVPNTVKLIIGSTTVNFNVVKNDNGSLSLLDQNTNKVIAYYDNEELLAKGLKDFTIIWGE